MNDPISFYRPIAAKALAKCAAYDPWFPKPSESIVTAWAEHFSLQKNLQEADILAAVTKAYNEHGSGFKPLPKDISDAARVIRRDRADRETAEERRLREAEIDAKAEGRAHQIGKFAASFGEIDA